MDNLEVYDYRINGPYIYVTLSNLKEEKILYTKENEEKVLSSMEKRIKKDNQKNDSSEEKMFFQKCKQLALYSSFFAILCSITILNHFNDSNFSQVNANILLTITSILHLFTSGLYEVFNLSRIDTIKFNLFFKNKREINEYVKKNPQLLDNIKSDSKNSIIKNIEEKKENPVNVNNINSMKLKELKELVQKIKFYKESNFETEDDVINKQSGIDELIERYDALDEVKKKELVPNNKRLQR